MRKNKTSLLFFSACFVILTFSFLGNILLFEKTKASTEESNAVFVGQRAILENFSMTSKDGQAKINIPSGSIRRSAFIEIKTTESYPPLPVDKNQISKIYHYSMLPATNNALVGQINLEIKYYQENGNWKEIFIYNDETKKWQNTPGTINTETKTVLSKTSWASGYIVVLEDKVYKSEYLKKIINSPSIIVADAKTGEILLERDSETIRPIASLTKLATTAVFLDHNPGWNKLVAMIPEDDTIPSKIYAKNGDVFTTNSLFYATLIKSANNATKALARSTGLSNESFVFEMNKKAKDLGMNNTFFDEPTGLSNNNVSTAMDFLKISSALFADPLFLKTTTPKIYMISSVSGQKHTLINSNKLLDVPYVVIGSKTGFTNSAGRCLAMKVRNKNGKEIIAITIGADTPGAQWEDMRLILDATLSE
jgi:serine-type D-Ala-D-Ala endopeptidase (penicillin-binding protein 7)